MIFSVGKPKHVRVMAGALEGDVFLGSRAEVWGRWLSHSIVLTYCRNSEGC